MSSNAETADVFNAAVDLIDHNLAAGRAQKTAVIDKSGAHSYQALSDSINRFANALKEIGIQQEQRIILCLNDTIDFPVCFLGAIKAGVIPVPINTRFTEKDYQFILNDSRATALIVSSDLLGSFERHLDSHPALKSIIVSGEGPNGYDSLTELINAQSTEFAAAETSRDDMCFWLYTSGTTGMPKGTVHLHGNLRATADLYAKETIGIREDDIMFSAAKLFFAYGLGNGLTFPFSVGATVLLLEGPPTPDTVCDIIENQKPTIFYGVPTLFAMLLASGLLPAKGKHNLRYCTSAGEALPTDLFARWQKQMGIDILDGIGSTEMLHIFLSNRPGDVRPGSTGKPVTGYDIRLTGDDGLPVPQGEMGALEISGPSSALMYWNRRDKSLETFQGPWTRAGDKYYQDEEGYFIYCGRTDDMLKVGGIYVSPFEVEAALIEHESVLEVAVVGKADSDQLIKPRAVIVVNQTDYDSEALAEELKQFVKKRLAAFKYPRWIEFVDELPKTATGKIQRFKLR
ncbi:benzoate-CoA ligase family protein [Sneathiella sp. HT1-7]|uniref:benzoate-CoA ligase family protein n=1 Tax=Sneathiella sp. HT1-7 TaxID=2887192 RepID=UPI001D15BA38|nr:benzoate-CoA ligase family protein [Sneathiella sp. HT1-7]MCC3306579.1 benzoate-CoA ligase family protein [Sneathiella sp. HT1-7]